MYIIKQNNSWKVCNTLQNNVNVSSADNLEWKNVQSSNVNIVNHFNGMCEIVADDTFIVSGIGKILNM